MVTPPPELQLMAAHWDAIPADKRAHVAALIVAAAQYAGLPAPALPPCAYRGSLITRAPCGCDERNSYQCSAPALMIDGHPAPIIGAVCQTCKYRAAPKK